LAQAAVFIRARISIGSCPRAAGRPRGEGFDGERGIAHLRAAVTSGRERLRTPAGLLALVVAFGVLLRLYRFGEPILDQHAFRQTQTASTVWLWNRDGFDFFSYHVPMFGGGHWVLELPVYQTLVWALQVPLGGIESASRIVSIGCYVASAVLLYLIASRWLGSRIPALLAVAVFTMLPVTVFFFRAVLIDTLAIALTLLAVYAATRLAERFGWTWFAVLSVAVVAAVLVKGTMVLAIGGATVVLGLRVLLDRRAPLAGRAGVVLLAAVAGALSAVWTRHADDLNLASGALTFSNGESWYFGTTFTDPDLYRTVLQRFLDNFGPIGLLLVAIGLAGLPTVRTRYRPELLATLVGAFLSIGIFANLNRVHDYYQLGYYIPLSLFAGLGLFTLYRVVRAAGRQLAHQVVAGVLVALFVLWSINLFSGYYAATAVAYAYQGQGSEMRSQTPDTRLVVIQEGGDKNEPMLWYEARRTGWRVPTSDQAQAERLVREHEDVGAIVFLKGASPEPGFVGRLAASEGYRDVYDSPAMKIYRRPDAAPVG
jgi:hypothetical protein